MEGLDYAFPESRKIGGVLSTTNRPRARALFAWSDNKDSQPVRGVGGGRKSPSSRRPGKNRIASSQSKQPVLSDQQTPKDTAAAEGAGAASSTTSAPSTDKPGNIFGNIFKMFSGGIKSESSENVSKLQPRGGFGSGVLKSQQESPVLAPNGSTGSVSSSNGMYLVGAVVLAMHGDVVMDTVTSMVGC